MQKKKESGFGVVEILVVMVVIIIAAGIGWSVFKAQQKKTDTSVKAPVSTVEAADKASSNPKKLEYKNEALGFSLSYPETWTFNEKNGYFTSSSEPTAEITFTTDDHKKFSITAHYGGKGGGPCEPYENDKFHSLSAQCATTEILSVDETSNSVRSDSGRYTISQSNLYIVERRITIPVKLAYDSRPAGTSYEVCMAFDEPKSIYMVKGTNFGWGISPIPSPIFRDSAPSFFYLDSCFSDTSESFLGSSTAKLVKELYKSLRVVQ